MAPDPTGLSLMLSHLNEWRSRIEEDSIPGKKGFAKVNFQLFRQGGAE
jgi:hypothetical protein